MKYIKYNLLICVTLLFIIVNSDYVHAKDVVRYEAVIIDEADLLTESEENMLYQQMTGLLEYGHMVFQTVTLNDSDYEGYAEQSYYNMYGNEPGILFQIDMGNRKLTLSASTKMEDSIGHERDSIVDNIYTMATDGNYYGCASECFNEIDVVIHDGEIAHEMKHINNAIFALILAILLNFYFAFATTRKKVSVKELLGGMATTAIISEAIIQEGKITKKYSPVSSGSSGGSSSGGSSGGGGGFSGGSSSHGF